jgi:hypothetical protein
MEVITNCFDFERSSKLVPRSSCPTDFHLEILHAATGSSSPTVQMANQKERPAWRPGGGDGKREAEARSMQAQAQLKSATHRSREGLQVCFLFFRALGAEKMLSCG